MFLILDGYRDRAIPFYNYKIFVNDKKGEISVAFIFILIYCSKDKLVHRNYRLSKFTINSRKSHRQPQCTWHRVFEDHMLFVWVVLHVSLCWQQHPKWGRTIRFVYPHFFCKLRFSSNPTNRNGVTSRDSKEFYLGNYLAWYTCSCSFILIMTDTVTCQCTYLSFIRTFPSEPPCIKDVKNNTVALT
jgi:hypothetical protein